MTSNVGLRQFQEQAALGFSSEHTTKVQPNYEAVKEQVLQELDRQFRPEFLNRIDKIVVFKPLDQASMETIVELQLQDLVARAKDKQIQLTFTKPLVKHLAEIGYTPQEGARAIRRKIQETIENRLAELLLADTVVANDTVALGFKKGEITLTVK